MEVLWRNGIHCEEVLEVTHLALVPVSCPEIGEAVSVLQVVPSKTDTDRLLVVWPELAHVLARVIAPVRGDKKHVLLVARYDYLKRIIRAPLPYLFQHQRGPNSQVLTHNLVKDMLDQALMRAGVTSSVGTLLRYTSHDFRRILATEAVSVGLPVRIGAKLLGHRDRAGNSVRVITPGPRRQRGP